MDGGSAVISVRHTKNIAGNLKKAQAEELKRIVDKVFAEADALFLRMVVTAHPPLSGRTRLPCQLIGWPARAWAGTARSSRPVETARGKSPHTFCRQRHTSA